MSKHKTRRAPVVVYQWAGQRCLGYLRGRSGPDHYRVSPLRTPRLELKVHKTKITK